MLAIVLAGVFAALGKWQLERSIENGKPLPAGTETRRALDDVTTPRQARRLDARGPEDHRLRALRRRGHHCPHRPQRGVGRTRPSDTWSTTRRGRASRS
ncbi:hypothetical protein [Curtobacterium sp. MCJR17_043]|uniref:hypothetical protein n=1 Tax=Curtobacterium sp. MCJR17_043 TaxID=2175660 RepID=UPI0024E02D0F|nr:hypothetical protein [Curtobacterium sp. MCJR17_043]WIB35834.1 hypothetical protein DEJ15_00355 [Curtobacterium sp. MCJR17_043]